MADKVKPTKPTTTTPSEKGISTNDRPILNNESLKIRDKKPVVNSDTEKRDKK
ncbi:MAG: hypothetical protein ACTTJC_02055 [Campylobacter sp.]